MKNMSVFHNFAQAVGHGIHSITLQDVRAFFDKDAVPENRIPTVNRNIKVADEDIIVPNAPNIPGEFKNIAMHSFDVALTFMDDPDYMMRDVILERLVHLFHMHELWTKAQVYVHEF